MAVGLFDLDQHPLKVFGPVVGLVEGYLDIPAFKVLFADDADPAVDPDGVVDSGYEEDQTDVGIVVDILVGLEQPVTGHVGEKQVLLVQHLDEAGLAALGGCVAAAFTAGGGHDREGGVPDELLDVWREMGL